MTQYFQIGKARIACLNRSQAIDCIMQLAQASSAGYVVTPNSDHMVMLEESVALQRAYAEAALVLADGMPLVWASRLLGPRLPARVTGADLMPKLCAVARDRGLRVFFLGAAPGVALRAKQRLESSLPGLQVCGTYSPPLGFEKDVEETQRILDMLRSAKAHLIFVGFGAPKQELWMAQNCQAIPFGVMLGIGAAIDFCAGHIRRAPNWMQSLGLEWVYRLLQEPRRLARRYLRDTKIVLIIWREWRQRGRQQVGP